LWDREDIPLAISGFPLKQDIKTEKRADWKVRAFNGNRLVLYVPLSVCGSPLSIRLFNLQGKTVFTSRTEQAPSTLVIREGLADGCYLLMIKSAVSNAVCKVNIFR
jgi:hypothetical protein